MKFAKNLKIKLNKIIDTMEKTVASYIKNPTKITSI